MQILDDPSECCGCTACSQICPKQCITMNKNFEGFLYPTINDSSCIHCKLCTKACPILNNKITPKNPLRVFAYSNADENIKMTSSSGGAFYHFASNIIKQGGSVIGAGFNSKWEVCHQEATTAEELENLKRSKYVQSDINGMYKRTQDLLKEGKIVLFTGTPCQIAGLHTYLRKAYNNLYTIDIICHGVPSPDVFAAYVSELPNYNTCNINSNPIKFIYSTHKNKRYQIQNINFRSKERKKLWRFFSLRLSYKSEKAPLYVANDWTQDTFLKGFLDHLFLRKSCHNCRFRNLTSGSDITIGDFWGIEKYLPVPDDNKGINAVIVNTPKGQSLCYAMNTLLESTFQQVVQNNISLVKSPSQHIYRNFFFKNYKKKGMIFTTLICIQKSITAIFLRKIILKNKFV